MPADSTIAAHYRFGGLAYKVALEIEMEVRVAIIYCGLT
jgi:hypothetical protein